MKILSATVAVGIQQNLTIDDIVKSVELLKSIPPTPKNITFNSVGWVKFTKDVKLDKGSLNFYFDGLPCYLVQEQIDECKVNYE